MKKKFNVVKIVITITAALISYGNKLEQKASENVNSSAETFFKSYPDYEAILEQAKGTTVTFYGWGGDEYRNKWLSEDVASVVKEKYDITLEPVPMDIDQILNKLSSEKQAGTNEGSIDMIWINGENFYFAKENNLLFGPFLEKLTSYEKYLQTRYGEAFHDFGYLIEGYEAPYGKSQLVFIVDSAKTPETPSNTEELLEFAKKYKGQVTYPAPPDFTGSAFVRNVIYDICGYEQFMNLETDKEALRRAIAPAMEYLRSLNPYLWNEGKVFPASSNEQENMFSNGELVFHLSYSPYSVATRIKDGTYPDTTKIFLFDRGTIGNVSYIAIAENAPNKAGALIVTDYIMSAAGQLSQFEKLGTLPVVDDSKLTDEEKAKFENVDIGIGTLSQDELFSNRLPEMRAQMVPIIEEIWLEEVVGK